MKTMEFTNEEFQTLREALEERMLRLKAKADRGQWVAGDSTNYRVTHDLLTKLEEADPDDYEACGECGFDHAYEHAEAQEAHEVLAKRVQESA